MKRNKKLLFAGISVILGAMCMRFATAIIRQQISPVIMISGAVLFLGGIIFFANTLFDRRDKF